MRKTCKMQKLAIFNAPYLRNCTSYKKADQDGKLAGPWTTTQNERYLSAMRPLRCRLVRVVYKYRPTCLTFWWKWPLNGPFSKIPFHKFRGDTDSCVVAYVGYWEVNEMWRHYGLAGTNKNLAVANRSRVSCMSRASMITPWPWNLG